MNFKITGTAKPRVAFALTGLGGSNAYGAGFLQAALDCKVRPEIITCTSGMLYWTWRYLETLKQSDAVQQGCLRREVKAQIKKAEPFPMSVDLLNTLNLMSSGVDGIFRWATPEYWQRWLKQPFFSLRAEFPKTLADMLYPTQLLTPTRSPKDFHAMADTFNESNQIGVCFNSLLAQTGTEYLHLNAKAKAMLEEKDADIAKFRQGNRARGAADQAEWRTLPKTIRSNIDAPAIEDALWLTMYGKHTHVAEGGLSDRIDGAYMRSIILRELTMVDRVMMPRPVSYELKEFPSNYFEGEDFKTELWWNASYAPQVAAIEFVNQLVLAKDVINKGNAKFKNVELIPVEIDVDRGYFCYFREDLDTFDRGYNIARSTFEKLNETSHPV